MKEIYKRVLKELKNARVSKQITQEELASLANLHRTYIGSVERGERNVTIANLLKICAALQIQASTLFQTAEENTNVKN